MSFRELRNFCEVMRGLGYPRIISLENFKKPNFELVADILYWLAQRYDPKAQISDNIEDERNRVEFIKQVATLFASKARIKVNTRKLYQADGYACQELLKIATMLYKAYYSTGDENEESQEFSLPTKLSNIKAIRQQSIDITNIGAKLHDLFAKEEDLQASREKAMQFLDNIQSLESNDEQKYIEQCIQEIIVQQTNQVNEMKNTLEILEKDDRTISEKIKKKQLDLERSEKRLQNLTNVKPAYMEEYERYEKDLEKIYYEYLDKFRNLQYLEHELDIYNKQEQEKLQQNEAQMNKMRMKIKEEEMRILRGDSDIDHTLVDNEAMMNLDQRGQSRGSSRPNQQMRKQQNGFGGQAYGSLNPEDDEDEEEEDDDENGQDEQEDEEEDDDEEENSDDHQF